MPKAERIVDLGRITDNSTLRRGLELRMAELARIFNTTYRVKIAGDEFLVVTPGRAQEILAEYKKAVESEEASRIALEKLRRLY